MPNSKRILFIGGMFFDSTKQDILNNSKAAVQNAANKLQWNYVNGFEFNLNQEIDILNSVFVGSFPQYYKKLLLPSRQIPRNNKKVQEVGFINLPIISCETKLYGLKKQIRKWLGKNKDFPKVIVAYGFFRENILALGYAKKIDPSICTCLIVLDLPEYMSQNNKYMYYKNWIGNSVYRCYNKEKKFIDCYSIITKQIADKLKLSENYVIIEGMIEQKVNTCTPSNHKINRKIFSFLYTGGLSESYGIDDLLYNFNHIKDNNLELWICGDGPMKEQVQLLSKLDKRIKYFGTLPQNKCIELQYKADCLINPRMDSNLTNYSFPSKTMEYLASGTPVIAKRLKGMPNEYSDFLFNFDSKEDMKICMEYVSKQSDEILDKKAQSGRHFVYSKKNNVVQTQKLLNLFDLILEGM